MVHHFCSIYSKESENHKNNLFLKPVSNFLTFKVKILKSSIFCPVEEKNIFKKSVSNHGSKNACFLHFDFRVDL